MRKEIDNKLEDIFLHNKLFFLVIKKINSSNSCFLVVQNVIAEIVEKLSEKKYNVEMSEEDKKELTKNAYEILYYLETQKIIVLTDVLRLKNHYKVSFDIYKKTEAELYQEFTCFIEATYSTNKNQSKLAVRQLASNIGTVRQFFVLLNSGLNINDTIMEITKNDNRSEKSGIRTAVFYLWLFGYLKGYIRRLYEVPIPYPVPTAPLSNVGSQYDEAMLMSMKRRHQSSAFDYLSFKACRDCLLTVEYSKDEIIQRLDISESTYYDLLRDWNISTHIYIEF